MSIITMFHGTNKTLSYLAKGSWVTSDYETAKSFADEKCELEGGKPVIYKFQINEDQIDWDIMAMASGVDDERGTLIKEFQLNIIARTPIP